MFTSLRVLPHLVRDFVPHPGLTERPQFTPITAPAQKRPHGPHERVHAVRRVLCGPWQVGIKITALNLQFTEILLRPDVDGLAPLPHPRHVLGPLLF